MDAGGELPLERFCECRTIDVGHAGSVATRFLGRHTCKKNRVLATHRARTSGTVARIGSVVVSSAIGHYRVLMASSRDIDVETGRDAFTARIGECMVFNPYNAPTVHLGCNIATRTIDRTGVEM